MSPQSLEKILVHLKIDLNCLHWKHWPASAISDHDTLNGWNTFQKNIKYAVWLFISMDELGPVNVEFIFYPYRNILTGCVRKPKLLPFPKNDFFFVLRLKIFSKRAWVRLICWKVTCGVILSWIAIECFRSMISSEKWE